MEIVTSQEFMNRIGKNKEYKMLKQICSEHWIGRKMLKTVMGFEGMFHRYAVEKATGLRAFYIMMLHTASEKEEQYINESLQDICDELNKRYLEQGVNAEAKAVADKASGKHSAIRVLCKNWMSDEWCKKNM